MKMIDFEIFASLYREAKEYTDIDLYTMERGWQDWMNDLANAEEIIDMLKKIYDIANHGIDAVLSRYRSLKQVSVLYGIPYSTVQKWHSGAIVPPEYTVMMLAYITMQNAQK